MLTLRDDGRACCSFRRPRSSPRSSPGRYGPFSSRQSARETLRALAAEHRLCWRRLGLDRRDDGPCFQRQIERCAGACVGAESASEHDARLAAALARFAIPRWPRARSRAGARALGACPRRVDVHVLRDWCWLGTARDDGELGALLEAPPRPQFDIDVMRLLLRRHASATLGSDARACRRWSPVSAVAACAASTCATQAVSFFAYGRCRNSLGPCAFDFGPSTPVIRNCASGNWLPSIAMNGIVPPSPIAAAGLP